MKKVIKELEKYFETELFYAKVGLDKETDLIQRGNIVWYCTQRCLGAVQFANQLGADFGIVEAMFAVVKKKLEEMEKGA